jgi:ankyrin repeat protein
MVDNGADLSLDVVLYPVLEAVDYNQLEILKYLLEKGASVFHIEGLLNIAKRNGNDEIYDILSLYNKTNESILDELKGPTIEEVWDGLKDIHGKRLINQSIEMDFLSGVMKGFEENDEKIKQWELNQFLTKAVEKNDSNEVIEYLLKKGANPLNKSEYDTPLDTATFYENDDMVQLLKRYINKND